MEDDILQNFLDDTREHLEDIETDLLDIEAAGADFDPEMVNKVFRTAHSIKGSAGFLGFTKISGLSHKIENILDMIRSGKMIPTSDVVNVVLAGFDKLKEMVNDIGNSENADISTHVEMLVALTGGGPKQEAAVVSSKEGFVMSDGSPVFSPSSEELADAAKGGNFIYVVRYDLIADVQGKDSTPAAFVDFLKSSGVILDLRIDMAMAGTLADPEPASVSMYVLYSTILEPDMVNMVLKAGPGNVQDLTPAEPSSGASAGAGLVGPPGLQPGADKEVDEMSRQFEQAVSGFDDGGGGMEEILVETVAGFEMIKEGRNVILNLDGNLTIDRAAQVKEALLKALSVGGSDLEINLSKLESTDVSFLQLLLAALRTGHGLNGMTVHCAGSLPPVFTEKIEEAGLMELAQSQGLIAQA